MGLKLLCVVAHPDDECFAFGGALALAADAGVEVHVLCFTDGQAASNRGEARSPEELGRIRRAEFAASCDVLGVTAHKFLDYQDGQLEFANFAEAAGRLVSAIRAIRPDVVLTFAPDGTLNTHPDHTMVSAFTSASFHWSYSARRFPASGAPFHPQRLFLATTAFFMPGRPAPMPTPWTVTLDTSHVLARRQEAFRRHTSQAPLMEKTRTLFEQFGHTEHYTLAAQCDPGPAQQMTSLFDGLGPQA